MTPQSLASALQPLNWPLFALVTARVAGVVLIAPLWSMTSIPSNLRSAIAVVLSLALLPSVPATSVAIDSFSILVPMISELLLGVAIGLSATAFLAAVAVASEVISLQMGLSLGVALGGAADLGAPGVGQLEGQFSLAVYVALGGHLALITALHRSFNLIPPGTGINVVTGGHTMLLIVGSVFSSAVRVAAPAMVALLIVNLALAILNRAVPQLNTMMVAVPITVSVGLISLGATLPYALNLLGRWAGTVGPAADVVIRAFSPALALP
jgi:flagellar biosynthetic protein FliR